MASEALAGGAPFVDEPTKAFAAREAKASNEVVKKLVSAEDIQPVRQMVAALGGPTGDWSMNFDRTDPTFGTPSFAEREFIAVLLPRGAEARAVYEIQKAKDELHATTYFSRTVTTKGEIAKDCEKLAAVSRANLKNVAVPKFLAAKEDRKNHK